MILLSRMGLLTPTKRVRQVDLIRAFTDRFPPDLLACLGCELGDTTKMNWLTRMAAGLDGKKHPLYRLLFIEFANISVEEFFGLDLNTPETRPFGVGPWPCLNIACFNYGKPVIETYRIAYDWNMEQPIGHFKCHCGFSYRRGGPDHCEADRYRFTKVETYGEHWDTRLCELWQNPTYNIRMIGRELAVDVGTVRRQANRLGLPTQNMGRYRMPPKGKRNSERVVHSKGGTEKPLSIENARDEWLSLMSKNPVLGVNSLRWQSPVIYNWLESNDADWLAEHLPTLSEPAANVHPRTDWSARDVEISVLIAPAADRIRMRIVSGRLVRVTKPEIGAELGIAGLLANNLGKLPLTAAAIAQYTETSAQFALRRINWLVEKCSREGRCPSRWGFIHEIHLAKILYLPEIREAVDEALSLLTM
jgi:hypothetical protein